jgi:hypothetical protein
LPDIQVQNRSEMRMFMRTDGLYGNWVLANTWSEALGLGGTFIIGMFLAPLLANSTSIGIILLGAFAAIVLGVLLEGALVGFAQERILRSRSIPIRPHEWIHATARGAGVAWLLGMVPSTIMAIVNRGADTAAPAEPSAAVKYGLAAVLGLLLGPVLAYAQGRVLRHHTSRARRWMLANALAWAAGMPIIFTGMDIVPWAAGKAAVIPSVIVVCAAAGLTVGAIHGKFLIALFGKED